MHSITRRQSLSVFGSLVAGSLGLEGAVANDRPPRIKIGQIGVGHGHATKLSVYRESPDYEVVGIVEADRELRRRAEQEKAFRGLPWMTQEELLQVPGLQAVLVETRVRDLLSTAEVCLLAGKHIHLDKPAGESWPHFRRILAMAQRQQLLVQMGYMYRYNPAIVRLREFLKNGWLGDVFEVHAVMSKVVEAEERRELAEYRGGILFELGGHLVDLVVAMLGKPTEVDAFQRHASPIDDPLVDNMLAVLEYPRAIATIKSSAVEVDGFARRHLVVCGTKGTFHIQPLDDPIARVTLAEPCESLGAGVHTLSFPHYTRYVGDAADMARIVRGAKASDFSYEHDANVQVTLLRACNLPVGDER